MVAMPDIGIDPTLAAIDRILEAKAAEMPPRTYLGASILGADCERFVWYSIRPEVPRQPFNAATIRRFEDGFAVEAQMIERLRSVPGIELWTVDENTGGQIGFQDFGGRFRGHVDGVVKGLYQSPKTAHVFECKAVNPKKFEEFRKLKLALPEKEVLAAWDKTYHVQAMIYCFYLEFSRHYLVVSTPGGRDYLSCRSNANNEMGAALRLKAKRILDSETPPSRISERPEHWKCKLCDYREVCHGRAVIANRGVSRYQTTVGPQADREPA